MDAKEGEYEPFEELKEEVDLEMAKQARKELIAEDPSLKEFFDHPINSFEINDEMMDNPLFQALQSMKEEQGGPDEVAEKAVNEGVTWMTKGDKEGTSNPEQKVSYAKAREYFNKGLEAKPTDKMLKFECLMGLIKAELGMGNKGKIAKLTEEAAKYHETPYLYSLAANASFTLDKFKETVDYCKKVLKLDSKNRKARELMKIALVQQIALAKKPESSVADNVNMIRKYKGQERKKVYEMMKAQGIKIGKGVSFLPDDVGEDMVVDGEVLRMPVVLLYDEFGQSELVNAFGTNVSFDEQLGLVLDTPAPWDNDHRYTVENIKVFYECNISDPIDPDTKVSKPEKPYKEVDLDKTLGEVLAEASHIVPQFPVFTIVAKDAEILPKYYE